MKTLALLTTLLTLTWTVLAECPKDSIPYQGGCAAMPQADTQTLAPAVGVVSDEKPSRHPEPAYQRGEVNAATPPSLAGQDATLDAEKAQADAQGKKAAGIKTKGEDQ